MRRRPAATLALAACAVLAACGSGESILQAGNDQAPPTSAAPTTTPATAPPGPPPTAPPGETLPATTAPPPSTTTTTPLASLPPCPVDALDEATGPVDITVWYGLGGDTAPAFDDLVARYNASQARVRVQAENQGSYTEALDKYVQSDVGSRPEVVMFPEYLVQQIADTDSTIPVGACIEASGFDTSPLLASALKTYATSGVQWALPFNMSVPVLYYNKAAFEAAGLDPDKPPVTLDELRTTAQALTDAGRTALVVDSGVETSSWYLEQWFARLGEEYVDNGNGRLARGTRVLFDGPTGVELMTQLQSLVQDGLAYNIGDSPTGFDQLYKMADAGDPGSMTMASSSALATVINVISGGGYPVTVDQLGIGPMPGPGDVASASPGGASLWIVDGKGDAQAAAAWDFIQFATSAEQQSIWADATGYTPVREDALALDPIRGKYESDPRFKVAYDQIVAGSDDVTSLVPVLGPLREVRTLAAGAVATIFDGADVQTTLTAAADQANVLISDYNARN